MRQFVYIHRCNTFAVSRCIIFPIMCFASSIFQCECSCVSINSCVPPPHSRTLVRKCVRPRVHLLHSRTSVRICQCIPSHERSFVNDALLNLEALIHERTFASVPLIAFALRSFPPCLPCLSTKCTMFSLNAILIYLLDHSIKLVN
jgi:hypothetical protein